MNNLIKLCIDFAGGGQLSASFDQNNFEEALNNFKNVLKFQTTMLTNPAYKGLIRKRDIRPTRKAHLSLFVGGERRSLIALEKLTIGVKAITIPEFINALFHDVKNSFELLDNGRNIAEFGYLPPLTKTRELQTPDSEELTPLSASIKKELDSEKAKRKAELKAAKKAYKEQA